MCLTISHCLFFGVLTITFSAVYRRYEDAQCLMVIMFFLTVRSFFVLFLMLTVPFLFGCQK